MDDHALLPNRGVVDADVNSPTSGPGAARHEEWLLDEGVEESFPASDPPSHARPGSLAAEYYSAESTSVAARRRRAIRLTLQFIVVASVIAAVVALARAPRPRLG